MAAVINIFEEMDPISVTENRLQPVPAHFVTGGADQIKQILAKTQDVCGVKGRLIVAWCGLVQINPCEERVKEHGLGGAEPLCTGLHIVNQQRAITKSFLSAAANDIGCFDDLVTNDQQDIAGTIIVVT